MRDVLIPSAAQLKRPFTYEGVRVLALFGGAGAAEVDQAIDDYTPSYPHTTTRPDWPAMNQTATLGDVIFSRHPDVFLIDWTPARLESAWYDPAAGTLAVSLSNHAGSPFAVRLYARRIPTEVRVNGAVVRCVNGAGDAAVSENVWQYERRNGELDIRLTGADAARQVEIRFGGENDYEHPYVRGMRK
jgi:hypothetical protein